MKRKLLALSVALFVSGCALRNVTIPPAAPVASPSSAMMAESTISITIPPSQKTSSAARRAAYISTATNSMVLTPQGRTPIVMPVTTTTPGCRTLNGARICTFSISLPIGTYAMRVALYASGDGTGTPLAMVSTTTTIVENRTNTIEFTLNAVLSAVSIALIPDGVFASGTAATKTINVGAADAGGATIVVGTDALVDSNGSAVTIQLVDTDTSGATSISSQTAGTSPSTLSYNGTASDGGTITATAVNAVNLPISSVQATFTVTSGPVCGTSTASDTHRHALASSCVLPTPIPVPTPFMAFPLACGRKLAANETCPPSVAYDQGAYTPQRVNTVLDHQLYKPPSAMLWQYGSLISGRGDGKITVFNGGTVDAGGSLANIYLLPGTTDATDVCGPPLTLSVVPNVSPLPENDLIRHDVYPPAAGRCAGTNHTSYDEHPGYDYYAEDQSVVKAVADGYVVGYQGLPCIPTGLPGGCDHWGFVGIDHLNGYISQYGHMDISTITLKPGDKVSAGQTIGLSSYTGLGKPSAAHLHFEVLARVVNNPDPNEYYNPQYWAVVDPYGWTAGLVFRPDGDPLYSWQIYRVKPTQLWK
jgi:hypothetical protein